MTTYLIHGFDREDHQKNVCIVLDAGDDLVEVNGEILTEAFAAVRALDPANRFCFAMSRNLSQTETVPEELKNRVLDRSELYERAPWLDPDTLSHRKRRR
jgi:hypothetical protein